MHIPLTGPEIAMPAGRRVTLPAREDFEYGVISVDGPATVADEARIEPGMPAHLPAGNAAVELSAAGPNRFFLMVGVPHGEHPVMWWNFAGRAAEEIAPTRDSPIAADGRFGEVRLCRRPAACPAAAAGRPRAR